MMPNNVAQLGTEHRRANYEIVEPLGEGGSGVVYKARDLASNRWVALKFLREHLRCDPIARACLADEARIGLGLAHPNLCTTYDTQIADAGDLVIVMKYYGGPTLKRRLQRGPLPIEEAIALAAQIADGLAYLHRRGIAHGDIKPSNVIVTGGKATVVDFGLASMRQSGRRSAWQSARVLGTAPYMAPEQTRGHRADARTDMWALGVVLYEMLAGRTPFSGSYAEAIAYAIRHDTPPPLSRLRIGVPAALERVVQKLLEKNPNRRSISAAAVAFELRALTTDNMSIHSPCSDSEAAA
jgi:eukaryotic-like serine/threonine-protein kinase